MTAVATEEPIEVQPPGFTVGFAVRDQCAQKDHTVIEQQRDALEEMLTRYGHAVEEWQVVPEVREFHNHGARVGIDDFGSKLGVDRSNCQWAILGLLKDEPSDKTWLLEDGKSVPTKSE
jgi:hypothetical protein